MEKGDEKKTNGQKAIKELKEAIREFIRKDKPIKSNTMKKFLLISGLMILISFSLFAQDNNKDTATVLQKCIEMKDLQQVLPLNSDGTVRQLYILQHGVTFPANTDVTIAGKKVVLADKSQLADITDPYYLFFWDFKIRQNRASAGFVLNNNKGKDIIELFRFVAQAEKKGTEWVIIDLKIIDMR